MKLAIIGSRNIHIDDLSPYIPADCDEIISGGARGVDTCAAEYARSHNLKLTEFLPDYKKTVVPRPSCATVQLSRLPTR